MLEFFAGSGLVRYGLDPDFRVIWANDICPKKAAVYQSNFGNDELVVGPIEQVLGRDLPSAEVAWASFPCQDLSLAGSLVGLQPGSRSGLYWEWLRVLDEMPEDARPSVLVAENVVGFLVAQRGAQFRMAYDALRERGYRAGALVLDAVWFLPQSRPRAFLVAVRDGVDLEGLELAEPPVREVAKAVMTAWQAVGEDPGWVWWALPSHPRRWIQFADICEWEAPCDPEEKTAQLLSLLSEPHRRKVEQAKAAGIRVVGTGYKRTRPDENGVRRQRLEVRFDGVAGCLRTPEGGSSRQVVLLVEGGRVRTRLLTVREVARLMGAPDDFWLPKEYNDGYRAMGDAVAAPVTRWLSRHLLLPLVRRIETNRIMTPVEESAWRLAICPPN